MDLHCLLAPRRQTIQFPLPAPELAGAGRFLIPRTTKCQVPPESAALGKKQSLTINDTKKRTTAEQRRRLRKSGACQRFNAC
jgi:hypothetical protein